MAEYLYWLLGVWWLLAVVANGTTFLIPIRRNICSSKGCQPGVSVLVPVKGVDAELGGNFDRLLNQSYPTYEVLFLVADPLDPAISFIKPQSREVRQFPQRS